MMGLSGSARADRPPFTPTQWQELEHQALIYKYMVSGVPIPPELIFSIRRSLDSSLASRLLPHHQPIGWGCFQMGFGKKPDPEPGRCRRTDGKKWRCSREAYPDSKYCEKHMHRGRNRSRKPVENPTQTPTLTSLSSSSSSATSNNNLNCSLSYSSSPSSASASSSSMDAYSNSNLITSNQTSPRLSSTGVYLSHSLYPYPSSPAKAADSGLSLENSSSQLNVLGSGNCSLTDKDFRYLNGIGESVGERTFFPEASRSFHDSPYHHHHHRQHCFLLGSDMFKPTRTITKTSKQQDQYEHQERQREQDQEDHEPTKPLHHFFGNDWPPTKNSSSDSWLDLASNSRLHNGG